MKEEAAPAAPTEKPAAEEKPSQEADASAKQEVSRKRTWGPSPGEEDAPAKATKVSPSDSLDFGLSIAVCPSHIHGSHDIFRFSRRSVNSAACKSSRLDCTATVNGPVSHRLHTRSRVIRRWKRDRPRAAIAARARKALSRSRAS